jgi:serpin B
VRAYFDGRVQGLDFDDPGAANTINSWVRTSTKDRIEKMVDPPIDPLTMAYVMNAVYFKGDWTKEFDPDDTYSGPFHPPSGPARSVDFMQKEDTLWFRASSAWQAVEIPYGGGAFVMTVAVPNEGRTLSAVADDLGTLLDPEAAWSERVMEVHIPRFELEWERLLNDDLKALGMLDAFSPSAADFTPMYRAARDAQLHVKNVKQKTFLKVDEKGTEAAAVTSVEVGVTSLGPPPFKADRPFLLAIRERFSGTVLFAGFIVQAPVD